MYSQELITEDKNFQSQFSILEARDVQISLLNLEPTWLGATNKSVLSHLTNLVSKVKTLDDTADMYQGDIDCSANPNYPAAYKGDYYYASVAGKIGGASGKVVEAGDRIACKADAAAGDEAAVGTSWAVNEHNLQIVSQADFETGTNNTQIVTAKRVHDAGIKLDAAGTIELEDTNILLDGEIATEGSVTIVPQSDLAGLTITGTNIATAHVFDLNGLALTTGSIFDIAAITTKTSGYLYNGSMTTSVLDASTLLDDFSVSCAHDGLAADTLRMIRRTWSGDMPNGTANADFVIFDGAFSGTVGLGGAEGGTIVGLKSDLTGATLNGSAVNCWGVEVDANGITNTSSADLSAMRANGAFDSIFNIDGAAIYLLDLDGCSGANGTITSDSGTAATVWKARIKIKTDDGTDAWINAYSTSNEA